MSRKPWRMMRVVMDSLQNNQVAPVKHGEI